MKPDLKEYWENVHAKGHGPCTHDSETVNLHNIGVESSTPRATVMEIGPGDGKLIRSLARKQNVTTVDIAANALKNVEDCCDFTYLTEDMDKIPSGEYDLVVCQLVFQHCPDEAVDWIMKHAIRSLKQGVGLFSFQFAFLVFGDELTPGGGWWGDRGLVGSYLFFRNPQYMRDTVEEYGGTVTWESPVKPHNQIGWQVFHVRKLPKEAKNP
jgi:hypothetical protein